MIAIFKSITFFRYSSGRHCRDLVVRLSTLIQGRRTVLESLLKERLRIYFGIDDDYITLSEAFEDVFVDFDT